MKTSFTEEEIDGINKAIEKRKFRIVKGISLMTQIDEGYENRFSLVELQIISAYLQVGMTLQQAENLAIIGVPPKEFNGILKEIR